MRCTDYHRSWLYQALSEVSMNKIALWISVCVDDWIAERGIIASNRIAQVFCRFRVWFCEQNVKVYSHRLSQHSMIDPGLQPHWFLFTSTLMRMAQLPCWPPSGQQVLHQRWIWGFCCMQAMKHASEGIHPGFGTQGRHHQKSKTGVLVGSQKGLMSSKIFFKKSINAERKRKLHVSSLSLFLYVYRFRFHPVWLDPYVSHNIWQWTQVSVA